MLHFSHLILIAAPSGTGKTSIVRHLLATFPELSFSISATTRKARKGEQHGQDYYFIDKQDFEKYIEENAFLEWNKFYDDIYYGTLYSELRRIQDNNKVPLLEIDTFNAIKIIKQYKSKIYSIFLRPPSIEALKNRLMIRDTEKHEEIKNRLRKAEEELSLYSPEYFQEQIINDNLKICKQEISQKVHNYLYNRS